MKPTKEEVHEKKLNLTMRDTPSLDDWYDMCEWYHEQCNEGAITLEWPEDSTHAIVTYWDGRIARYSRTIPQPSPKRNPQINDKVFFGGKTTVIHMVCGIDKNGTVLITGIQGWQDADEIKPATLDDMGKDWREVKGY
jgi:hypothetical protein